MEAHLTVDNLTMSYGSTLIQRDLNFAIGRGEIFTIMGGSGCGKSTLLRHMIGLLQPKVGRILFGRDDLWQLSPTARGELQRRCGIAYQSGALLSSMTVGENVALPLEQFSSHRPAEIRELVELKLALVGLAPYADRYPSQLSGGQKKRAALARALALDPEYLFFDEPSAGLDPLSSRNLDDLILQLRDSLGSTVVIVTHELPSIFAIADRGVLLDATTKTQIAIGNPHELLAHHPDERVQQFLRRGQPVTHGESA